MRHTTHAALPPAILGPLLGPLKSLVGVCLVGCVGQPAARGKPGRTLTGAGRSVFRYVGAALIMCIPYGCDKVADVAAGIRAGLGGGKLAR